MNTLKLICLGGFLAFAASPSALFAADGGKDALLDPERIVKLPNEERAKLPAFETMLAMFSAIEGEAKTNRPAPEKTRMKVIWTMKEPFRSFRYDVDQWSTEGVKGKSFVEAVKEVQRKMQQDVTGTLTVGQLEHLVKMEKQLNEQPVKPLAVFGVNEVGDSVFASGTMEIVREKIAYPINFHRLTANRRTMTCRDDYFELQNGELIVLGDNTFEVVSWTADEVVCTTEYNCRTEKLIIGLKTKEVTVITTNRDNPDCKDFAPLKLEVPRVSRLVDPLKSANAYYEARRKEAEEFVSDAAKAKLAKLLEE